MSGHPVRTASSATRQPSADFQTTRGFSRSRYELGWSLRSARVEVSGYHCRHQSTSFGGAVGEGDSVTLSILVVGTMRESRESGADARGEATRAAKLRTP